MARRMTRKVLDEKAETFNSMFEKSPGVTVQAGFQCYNIITIDPETKRMRGSELNVYGLTNWEAAHYLDGLIYAAGYIRTNKATFNR